MGMPIPYELTGRSPQKTRTRAALVAAARHLLAHGVAPTVEQAAAAASISRTTAYRYFPNQRLLLIATHPEVDRQSLLPESPPADLEARLAVVVGEFTRITIDTEPQLRSTLRLSLDPDPSHREKLLLRGGRAIGWIEDALAPLREKRPEADVHRLALAIRSAVGIEALVWLTDVAGLSREEAGCLMRWSARALLRSALADGLPAAPERAASGG
jgi:AcrR family transcriptional regulator